MMMMMMMENSRILEGNEGRDVHLSRFLEFPIIVVYLIIVFSQLC